MKKLYLPIFIFLLVAGGIIFYIYTQQKVVKPPTVVQKPTITPTSTTYPLLFSEGVTPGTTTKQDTVTALGNPINTQTIGNTTTLIYKSSVGNKATDIDIGQNGIVTRIVQPVPPEIHLDYFLNNLGAADATFYGLFGRDFRLYVYLSKGVAILGNPNTQQVIEQWFFKPTDIDTFKTQFGEGLTTIQPDINQQ